MDIPADLLQTVYIKTGKAHEEIADRRHNLRPKARQVLVMLDGVRTVGMLTAVIAGFELPALLAELEKTGFIESQSENQPESRPDDLVARTRSKIAEARNQRSTEIPPTETITLTAINEDLDPLALLEIKLLMQETTQQYLGLLGADLKKQITAIRDAAGLRATLARWHMALRESRKGADMADDLLIKVKRIAGWDLA